MKNLKFKERNECPLCDCDDFLIHIDFENIPIVQCKECSFLYVKRIMDNEVLEEYYKNFSGNSQQQGQLVNSKVNFQIVRKIIRKLEIKNILDVGTGYGYLLSQLNDKLKIDVSGMDLSENETSFAVNELGLDVRRGLLNEVGFPKEDFDLVMALETIEHIENPVEFVRELSNYIKPNKYLLLVTDNFKSDIVRKFGVHFPKWIPHAHISDFCPDTILSCIEKAGNFNIVSTNSYTPWELKISHLLGKRKPTHNSKMDLNTVFNLQEVLKSEMNKSYKYFGFRRIFNQYWAKLTLRNDLNGAMMYVLAQKIDTE